MFDRRRSVLGLLQPRNTLNTRKKKSAPSLRALVRNSGDVLTVAQLTAVAVFMPGEYGSMARHIILCRRVLRGVSFDVPAAVPRQPEGLADISRGLSVSDTPGRRLKTKRTLEGRQNCPPACHGFGPANRLSRTHPDFGPETEPASARFLAHFCELSWFIRHRGGSGTPPGCWRLVCRGDRGYRRCAPRPPANFWQPSRLRFRVLGVFRG